MDIGVFCAHEQHRPTTLLSHATAAETAGLDSVWTSDHFHPWWDTGAHCGAAWPWLGVALERTDSLRIGTGVTAPVGRYHPGLIAQVFATLGALYPGRVHVCLATGEAMNERPLGYDWPPYEERRERLVDACEVVSRLWGGTRGADTPGADRARRDADGFLDYDGHHWTLDTAKLYTLPDERVPLYVAGNGPETARVAGMYADGFLTLVEPAQYRDELVPALEAGAEAVGRDPDEIRRIRQKSVAWADDERAAREAAGFWRGSLAVGFDEEVYDPREVETRGRRVGPDELDEWGLITADIGDVVAEVDRHREAGFDEVEFLSSSPDQRRFVAALGDAVGRTG